MMELINQINLGNNFMKPIEPINRLIQTHPSYCNIVALTHQKIQQLQAFLYTKK